MRELLGWLLIKMKHLETTQYHRFNFVKSFPMETEGLFKEDFVFGSPLLRKGQKILKVFQSPFNVVLVPKQHA